MLKINFCIGIHKKCLYASRKLYLLGSDNGRGGFSPLPPVKKIICKDGYVYSGVYILNSAILKWRGAVPEDVLLTVNLKCVNGESATR